MAAQRRDAGLVSSELHEVEYIHQQFPNSSHEQVERALKEAKSQLGGSEDRSRIMEILRQKLK